MAQTNDLTLYDRHADQWWDARSKAFRSLHRVNEFRTALLTEWLGTNLEGQVAVDLGCGGGLLCAHLESCGARWIGVDLSFESLKTGQGRLGRRFARADVAHVPLKSGCADLVLAADVLEHVKDTRAVLAEAARLLKPGGALYVNTINRTRRAKLLAVDLAEGVGLVPRGTHDAALFVDPDELRAEAWHLRLSLEELQGESVDVIRTVRSWAIALRRSNDISVGYSALFRKVSSA